MSRSSTCIALVALLLAGCARGGTPVSNPPSRLPDVSAAPTITPTFAPTAAPMAVPGGRILARREGPDGVEHFFTVNTDGTDERALYDREGCGCARWSHDGKLVYTLDATGHGTWSFATIRPDGTGLRVLPNAIPTLNLAPGASSSDGNIVAFWGWDETGANPNGLYLATSVLGNVHLVTPVPEGATAVEPFGITPDGSKIIFFAETGRVEQITHAGDLYIVDADGSHLRKLNPDNTSVAFVGATPSPGNLSADGRRVAFAAFETASGGRNGAVYVADVAGAEPRRVTEPRAGVYTVIWSPTGEWIAYTTLDTSGTSVSLVRPDGSEGQQISPASEDIGYPSWSPDGTCMVVRRGRSDANDLWVMDLEGRFLSRITDEPSDYAWFTWSPA